MVWGHQNVRPGINVRLFSWKTIDFRLFSARNDSFLKSELNLLEGWQLLEFLQSGRLSPYVNFLFDQHQIQIFDSKDCLNDLGCKILYLGRLYNYLIRQCGRQRLFENLLAITARKTADFAHLQM